MASSRRGLSPLEHESMAIIWARGPSTADDIGAALKRPLKNATVRTLLRRMEAKGYVRHRVVGRAFVYEARLGPGQAATGAVRRIVDRFFGGSVADLLVGLVDEGVVDREELRILRQRLAERRKRGPR